MTIRTTARNTVITGLTAVALATGSGLALAADNDSSGNASQGAVSSQAQGMVSAEQLMDASVYAKGDDSNAVGEVDDLLLGKNMQIRSYVIETKGKFGVLGGKSYVVSADQVSVQTRTTDKATKPDYRVQLDMTRNQLGKQPVYSDAWWSNAQSKASAAWQDTKSTASSAWSKVKSTTSDLVNGTKDKAGDAADATGNAADKAGDKISGAAGKAGDKASNTADKAGDKASDAANKAAGKADKATDNN